MERARLATFFGFGFSTGGGSSTGFSDAATDGAGGSIGSVTTVSVGGVGRRNATTPAAPRIATTAATSAVVHSQLRAGGASPSVVRENGSTAGDGTTRRIERAV